MFTLVRRFFSEPLLSPETSEAVQATYLRPLHLSKLADHFHVVLASTLACVLLRAASALLCPLLCPHTYPRLTDSQKRNWDTRVVSMVHCLLIVWGALQVWEDPKLKQDRVFGYDFFAGNVYAVATGYFLWDAIVTLRRIKENGVGFFLHGAACFFVFIFAFKPFLMYYGSAFLMFELSTPFLNINWFMDKMGMAGSFLQLINGIVLLTAFFCARIVFGFIVSWHTYVSVEAIKPLVPTFFIVLYTVANLLLNGLNVYWFGMMIKALRKRFNSKSTKSHMSKEGLKKHDSKFSVISTDVEDEINKKQL